MEFLTIYNVIILLCVLCMMTMSVHTMNNVVFGTNKKHWFVTAFMLVAVCAIAECVGTFLSSNFTGWRFHYVLTFLEFGLSPFIPVCMSFACGIKKPAKIIGIIGLVHIAIELIMISFGGIFYITADGVYHRGKFYFIYIIMYLISYLYNLILIALISSDYKSKDIGSVVLTIITILSGLIPSIIDGSIRTAYLCVTLLVILEYLYFESLYEQDLQKKITSQSEYMNKELIKTLSFTLEAKDVYTKGHSMRVAEYTKIIASHMGFDTDRIDKLHFAATLHDIGKIGIPDTVLNKPGKLTDREYNVIKMHTSIGADILKNIESIKHASVIARHHHERYDGLGYPDGISGDNIPLEARIVAIADAYDAMTSKRVYRRKVLSNDIIREEFAKNKGKQFDPDIADVFLELLDKGELEPIKEYYSPAVTLDNRDEEGVSVSLARDQLLDALQAYEGGTGEKLVSIDDVLDIIEDSSKEKGAFSAAYSEFVKLFKYLENICRRFGHKCFLVMVSMESETGEMISLEDIDVAIEAFDISVRQTIREVDVCTRLNDNKYLIILVDSGEDNITDIMERIINHYYKIQGRTTIEPKYETRKISVNDKE